MNAIWTGAISFGMVTIPVKLYSATEQKDIRFRLLHRQDLAPVHEKRFCTAEDREVAWDDLVRGVEVSKGEFVTIDPSELEAIEPESAHTIEIDGFASLGDIDPVYFEKSYLLEPVEVGARPFALLRRTLEDTGRVAVARITIRTKERLAALRVYRETLMLETMFWPDEVRSTDVLDMPKEAVAKTSRREERRDESARELDMARMLVESLSGPFRPEAYTDRYREAVQELVDRKLKGQAPAARKPRAEPKVVDLMAALEASLAAAKGRGGGTARGSTATERDGKSAGGRADHRPARSRDRESREERETAGTAAKTRRRRSAA